MTDLMNQPSNSMLLGTPMSDLKIHIPVETKLCGLSPQANYMDQATATCQQS
jgi:hypothetical protein